VYVESGTVDYKASSGRVNQLPLDAVAGKDEESPDMKSSMPASLKSDTKSAISEGIGKMQWQLICRKPLIEKALRFLARL